MLDGRNKRGELARFENGCLDDVLVLRHRRGQGCLVAECLRRCAFISLYWCWCEGLVAPVDRQMADAGSPFIRGGFPQRTCGRAAPLSGGVRGVMQYRVKSCGRA